MVRHCRERGLSHTSRLIDSIFFNTPCEPWIFIEQLCVTMHREREKCRRRWWETSSSFLDMPRELRVLQKMRSLHFFFSFLFQLNREFNSNSKLFGNIVICLKCRNKRIFSYNFLIIMRSHSNNGFEFIFKIDGIRGSHDDVVMNFFLFIYLLYSVKRKLQVKRPLIILFLLYSSSTIISITSKATRN